MKESTGFLETAKFFLDFVSPKPPRHNEHKQLTWYWLRHGLIQARFIEPYIKLNPDDLERDNHRYGRILLEDVQLGQSLHDALGKPNLDVGTHIWYTPRELWTPEEMREATRHNRIGYSKTHLWFDSNFFPPVALDIILYHHEKLDGSGPESLVGDQIPYIVQVCAIFDQLLSRCHKRPTHSRKYSLRESYEIINGKKGVHFNKEVLEKVYIMLVNNVHLEVPGLRWLGSY